MTGPGGMMAAALKVASTGWSVFPCIPNGKQPLTKHGFKNATTDPSIIAKWWRRWPDANLAMPTGKATVDVLDVDFHGPEANGFPSFNRLLRAGLVAGAVAIVSTPSGGMHVYFRPSGQGNSSMPRHHLDVRGDGGYVLVPPSTVGGKPYVLADWRPTGDGRLDWADCKLLLQPPRRPRTRPPDSGDPDSLDALARWVSQQGEGNRNHALYWAAMTAVDRGHTDLAALVEAAVTAGLTEQESQRTAGSALRRRSTA
jgi:hypothetical protein